jgi:hypothetical protein
MTLQAAYLVVSMDRVVQFLVTLRASRTNGGRFGLAETKDFGYVAIAVRVGCPRTVAGFATLFSGIRVRKQCLMRGFTEPAIDVVVAAPAGIGASIVLCCRLLRTGIVVLRRPDDIAGTRIMQKKKQQKNSNREHSPIFANAGAMPRILHFGFQSF